MHARVDAADSVGQTVSTSPRVDTEAGEISVQRRVASSVVPKRLNPAIIKAWADTRKLAITCVCIVVTYTAHCVYSDRLLSDGVRTCSCRRCDRQLTSQRTSPQSSRPQQVRRPRASSDCDDTRSKVDRRDE